MRLGQRTAAPLEIFLWSRLGIWLAAIAAYLLFEPNRNPLADRWDSPRLHDLGWALDLGARWDSSWFLQIAEHGYSHPSFSPAFFPLYPGLVGGAGRLLGGHYVLAGTLVSLGAGAGAFVLLYRLAERLLDRDGARRTVLYLALFPMSLFLGAVYSESLYLLLSVAAFLLAERGRWLGSGLAAGLAILTRIAGVALLPALALLAWRARDRPGALARLGSAVAVAAVYPLVLWAQIGRPFEFLRAQRDGWDRDLSPWGPLAGLWHGADAGWAGVRQLAAGADAASTWPAATGAPLRVAGLNLQQLAFTVAFLALSAYAWRRFGAPYGLFCLASLALPLSSPPPDWPLLSLPRYGLGMFPIFLALGALGARPRVHVAIVTVSAVLLGVATAQWALWQWVS